MHLTKTELQIVQALSEGFTQREIAERRHRSFEMIKSHVKHSMEKLHARNAVNLIALAKDLGLIMLLVCVVGSIFRSVDLEDPHKYDQRRIKLARSFSVRGGRVDRIDV